MKNYFFFAGEDCTGLIFYSTAENKLESFEENDLFVKSPLEIFSVEDHCNQYVNILTPN